MESGWNVWVWLVGVVSRRWVWLVGVVVRRYIDFLILLIPTPLVSVLFCSSIPFVLVHELFGDICTHFFAQYKHTNGQLWASHGSHMKAAHNVLYMKKHTKNERFISCDGHQLYAFKGRV